MCIIGNPPYSGESANKGKWIMNLMEDYKKEPGGKEKLKERNPKAINDDYVKFLRYGQHFIEKNGSGVLAFINPHGFIDNLTYRGMRWNLLRTYDKIYTIDLHGNAKKKETAPDGSADINVFDIEQGVSINFFIKTGKKKANDLGQVFHFDLFGKREFKYNFLTENKLKYIAFSEIEIIPPNYFFVAKDFKGQNNYDKGISIDELFPTSTSGIKTHSDGTLVNFSKYENSNQLYNYRPFDIRNIEYDLSKVQRHRFSIMKNMLKENLAIMTCRQLSTFNFQHILISKNLVDMCTVSLQTKETTYAFPLYIYLDTDAQQTTEQTVERTPNLNTAMLKQIAEKLGLTFTTEKETTKSTFAPIDILDYIYAVLHSPKYREKYKEFLKIDFPRVPYPKDKDTFWQLVKLGGEMRQIHLLESPIIDKYFTQYPIDGNNLVGKIIYQNGKVYINDTQYFNNVPQTAWEFYIGGYQPAQKWLKDRKERTLEFDDILHYQKIIVALTETNRLMKEIDKIELEQ
jgi:predicted helicase